MEPTPGRDISDYLGNEAVQRDLGGALRHALSEHLDTDGMNTEQCTAAMDNIGLQVEGAIGATRQAHRIARTILAKDPSQLKKDERRPDDDQAYKVITMEGGDIHVGMKLTQVQRENLINIGIFHPGNESFSGASYFPPEKDPVDYLILNSSAGWCVVLDLEHNEDGELTGFTVDDTMVSVSPEWVTSMKA